WRVAVLPSVGIRLFQVRDVVHLAVAGGRRSVGRAMDPVTTGQRQAKGVDRLHRGPVKEIAAPEALRRRATRLTGAAVAAARGRVRIEVPVRLDDVEVVGVAEGGVEV